MTLFLLAFLVYPLPQQLDSPLTESFDQPNGSGAQIFGASVACTRHPANGGGYTIVFGAPGDDSAGLDAGAVYLVENGVLSALPAPADSTRIGDQFGQVAIDRNTLVVGAGTDDVAGFPQAGSITVYNRDAAGIWTEEVELDAAIFDAHPTFSLSEGDQFGAVDVHGDRIVVGARLADAGGLEDAGAAFVLERSASGWSNSNVLRLEPSSVSLRAGDLFGSVAIHGDTAVVGARRRDVIFPCNIHVTGGCDEGVAFVFERNSLTGQWDEVVMLTALSGSPAFPVDDRGIADEFGFAVAIHNDVIVIGAPGHDGGCGGMGVAQEVNCDTGAAFIYERDIGGQWRYKARIRARGAYRAGSEADYAVNPVLLVPSAFERFGYSVAIHGGRIVVGAPGRFELPPSGIGNTIPTGAAYVLERDPASFWRSTRYLSEFDFCPTGTMPPCPGEAGAFFGSAVAADANVIAVGAPFDSSPGTLLAGKGYSFYQLPDVGATEHELFCFGDGGDQMGCTDCQCGNNAPPNTVGGCLNSSGTSARLWASGNASVLDDTLRFELLGGPPFSGAFLNSAQAAVPVQPAVCPTGSGTQPSIWDGLRCIGGGAVRVGNRSLDQNGSLGITNPGFGYPDNDPDGILCLTDGGGPGCMPVMGTRRFFQAVYRDDPLAQCGTGLNTSNAVMVVFTP